MSNLELNEAVMTDLLELPAWMRITRVWCNRVTVRIHWTKLKSVPIYVVRVTCVRALEEGRDERGGRDGRAGRKGGTSGEEGTDKRGGKGGRGGLENTMIYEQ